MASNQAAYKAFRKGKSGKGSSTSSTGDKLFSYGTVILQRLPNGQTIGNTTKYSATTSKHQSQAGMNTADLLAVGVPRGTADLTPYIAGRRA